jgi:hypothetical protein
MFNVVENISKSLDPFYRAQHVFAFIGGYVYVIKSRNLDSYRGGPIGHESDIPQRPDRVIGIYYNNTTETLDVRDIPMRPTNATL